MSYWPENFSSASPFKVGISFCFFWKKQKKTKKAVWCCKCFGSLLFKVDEQDFGPYRVHLLLRMPLRHSHKLILSPAHQRGSGLIFPVILKAFYSEVSRQPVSRKDDWLITNYRCGVGGWDNSTEMKTTLLPWREESLRLLSPQPGG